METFFDPNTSKSKSTHNGERKPTRPNKKDETSDQQATAGLHKGALTRTP